MTGRLVLVLVGLGFLSGCPAPPPPPPLAKRASGAVAVLDLGFATLETLARSPARKRVLEELAVAESIYLQALGHSQETRLTRISELRLTSYACPAPAEDGLTRRIRVSWRHGSGPEHSAILVVKQSEGGRLEGRARLEASETIRSELSELASSIKKQAAGRIAAHNLDATQQADLLGALPTLDDLLSKTVVATVALPRRWPDGKDDLSRALGGHFPYDVARIKDRGKRGHRSVSQVEASVWHSKALRVTTQIFDLNLEGAWEAASRAGMTDRGEKHTSVELSLEHAHPLLVEYISKPCQARVELLDEIR